MNDESFNLTKQEVEDACDLLGYCVDDESIEVISQKLLAIRDKERRRHGDDHRYGCLFRKGAGVVSYVKNRLHEFGLLPKCSGRDEKGFFVIGRFHFFRIDENAREWDDKDFAKESSRAGIKRSPLSRLADASPMDAVARRIAGNGDRPCPYCKRYFRNPAAMVLHIKERHS
jgi:hypothetical protein